MPQHPIYIDLLPQSARAVIGQCHKDGEGARRLLEWEGFSFSNVVDIFDGGPLMSVKRDAIRTKRESRRMRVTGGAVAGGARGLVANPEVRHFRCVSTSVTLVDGAAVIDPAALAALKLSDGDEALVWTENAH
jgi:arginine N-succinyltransferase